MCGGGGGGGGGLQNFLQVAAFAPLAKHESNMFCAVMSAIMYSLYNFPI